MKYLEESIFLFWCTLLGSLKWLHFRSFWIGTFVPITDGHRPLAAVMGIIYLIFLFPVDSRFLRKQLLSSFLYNVHAGRAARKGAGEAQQNEFTTLADPRCRRQVMLCRVTGTRGRSKARNSKGVSKEKKKQGKLLSRA